VIKEFQVTSAKLAFGMLYLQAAIDISCQIYMFAEDGDRLVARVPQFITWNDMKDTSRCDPCNAKGRSRI
jgi:hypothetical protein